MDKETDQVHLYRLHVFYELIRLDSISSYVCNHFNLCNSQLHKFLIDATITRLKILKERQAHTDWHITDDKISGISLLSNVHELSLTNTARKLQH